MPYAEIKNLVLNLDDTQLTLDRLQTLIQNVPNAEETELVTTFEGDKNTLGNVEKFFLEMTTVPRLKERLEAFKGKTAPGLGLCVYVYV